MGVFLYAIDADHAGGVNLSVRSEIRRNDRQIVTLPLPLNEAQRLVAIAAQAV